MFCENYLDGLFFELHKAKKQTNSFVLNSFRDCGDLEFLWEFAVREKVSYS